MSPSDRTSRATSFYDDLRAFLKERGAHMEAELYYAPYYEHDPIARIVVRFDDGTVIEGLD